MANNIVHIESTTPQKIENRIFTIRGTQVMLDRDIAALYGIQTGRLNEQVKRNIERFPESFRFQLTTKERDEVIANCDNLKDLKFNPSLGTRWCAFTLIRDFTSNELLSKIM